MLVYLCKVNMQPEGEIASTISTSHLSQDNATRRRCDLSPNSRSITIYTTDGGEVMAVIFGGGCWF